ncbi:MAG: hypothetical protein KKC43_05355 [Alphaproteobacteria bacterium]|nr:hypothetical protein [Alphaproteobacteria bacterium]
MILRRLTDAFRKQDWFTVAVETLIVVLGVFLGLQVQNWTSEHGRRQLEASYTVRLHEEVVSLQGLRDSLLSFRDTWAEGFRSAASVIFEEDDRDLTPQECEAIVYSYIVTNPTDDLASLIELQGSGQLSLFRNKRVSEALSNYLLVRSRVRDAGEGVARSTTNLSGKYPSLVSIVSSSSGPGVASEYACDLEAMRADQAFLNDFETTKNSYLSHATNNKTVNESLADLHRVLEDVLGIAHEETP